MAWQPHPGWRARLLQPLAWMYLALAAAHRAWWRHLRRPARLPVPVVVVGNLVVGGAGKTPVVIALVQALRAAGWSPGVVARGYGRAAGRTPCLATPASSADEIGDEPLLIQRRSAAPLAVGAQRAAAARLLLARHPEVDLIVCDDGLQHHALAHDAAVVVFDDRGAGNGLALPAGPLREPLPGTVPPPWLVLYTGRRGASTPLPGTHTPAEATRVLAFAAWRQGQGGTGASAGEPLGALAGRPLLALAGIGDPPKFFAALADAGLRCTPWPMPDHARYERPPWPAGTTDVVTTEKDAVKLAPHAGGAARVWVVPLDLTLPPALVAALLHRLPARPAPPSPPAA
ncbi:MAG: tetraacyldisaccharide 4'-kinase [Rubrivivax sp.]|nr:tetraacyldisaccharide 4'-kinase [Rubrivivax sp.]